jgi:hypothetical protein
MTSLALVILFSGLCGLGDALGFIHAARIWRGGEFSLAEALKSAAGFQFGVAMYWLALRELTALGVVSAEAQTLVWFVATIIGVAALSGQFLRWPVTEQLVAGGVLVGLCWLLMRAEGGA